MADLMDIAALTPTFFNTVFKHARREVPDTNWDLKLHLGVALVRNFLLRLRTIEEQQKSTSRAPIPSLSVSIRKATVPDSCRSQSEDIMAGLLCPFEEKIGWRWREDPMKRHALRGEWIELKRRTKQHTSPDRVILYIHGGGYFLGSAAQHRFLVQRVSKYSGARAFSINYRLAPQSPFPAALVDVLAAYFYLIDPPAEAGFEPINPENLVILGDSAGGGLVIALLMVLRDAGLPKPAAGVCWSPWVDLFHSLPSIRQNMQTDYIPNGFVHKASPANPIKDYRDIQQRLERIQYYAYNSALDIPYVSPILADDLGGLGNLFITCGNGERLRDEIILIAHKAAKTPYEIFNSDEKQGKYSYPPTKVNLQIYDSMPHVFQIFLFHPSALSAMRRTGAFIRKMIPEPLNVDGDVSPFLSLSRSMSLTKDDASLENYLLDEEPIFVQRNFDAKGKPREADPISEETFREWTGMLGKLPDIKMLND